jgi:hypothetical protein
VAAATTLSVALCGCSNIDFDTSQAFSRPLDVFGANRGGYTFSELEETKKQQRALTTNDLVSAQGSCPPQPMAAPQQAVAPGSQIAGPPPAPDTDPLLGRGVSLGMSECEIVYRAGQPNNVVIGKNPNGDRTAVLTFTSGPRPGIYRFERGQLWQMDLAQVSEPPPAAKTAKKKAAKSSKPPKKNDQT